MNLTDVLANISGPPAQIQYVPDSDLDDWCTSTIEVFNHPPMAAPELLPEVIGRALCAKLRIIAGNRLMPSAHRLHLAFRRIMPELVKEVEADQRVRLWCKIVAHFGEETL